MPTTTARPQPAGLPRSVVVLVGLAAAVVVVAGMRGVSGLLAPVFLALVLTVVAHPMRTWLDRWMPSWAASLVCIVVVYVAMLMLAFAIVVSVARFAELLPTYSDDLQHRVDRLVDRLGDLGVSEKEIERAASSFDVGSLTGFVGDLLGELWGVVSNLVFILSLVLFMTMDGGSFPRQLEHARAAKPQVIDALEAFSSGTRRYLLVSTVFGLVVAALDTVALVLLDVPLPLLWGLLAFITNYIPNIGFVIGLVPPAILALLEGGPGLMLAVIVIYCVLNVVIQSVIQPKVVGDTVGLSTTLSFFSLVFWTWVIGPLGALLAIPLTLFAKALLIDADPQARWLQPLISNSDQKLDAGPDVGPEIGPDISPEVSPGS